MPERPHPIEPPSSDHKVAIVLADGLLPGQAANIAACIAAGLAAARPVWAGKPLCDAAGLRSVSSSHQAIAILRAEATKMEAFASRFAQPGADVAVDLFCLYPAYAQSIHDAQAYWDLHQAATHAGERLLGLGLAGTKRWVNRWTGSLPLWR